MQSELTDKQATQDIQEGAIEKSTNSQSKAAL